MNSSFQKWQFMHLQDVCDIIKGKKPKSISSRRTKNSIPYILIESFGGNCSIFTEDQAVPVCKPDDILMVMDGARSGLIAMGLEGAIGSTLGALRTKNGIKLKTRYLYYFLITKYALLNSKTKGAAIPHVDKNILNTVNAPIPPIHIQEKIIAILDKTKSIMLQREQANQMTNKIIRSIFLKMFNLARANRENWKLVSIQDLALPVKGAIQSGPFGSDLHNRDFVKEGVLAIGIDNVYPNKFVTGRGRHITAKKYEELAKFTARPDDVLITIMGTVGRSCVFPASASPAIVTKHVYRISLDREKCLPAFLSSSMNWDAEIRRQLGASVTGAIVDGLTSRTIKSLKVRLPPFREQLRFVNLLNGYYKIQEHQQTSTQEISQLFNSLMSRAFRGELRIEASMNMKANGPS